MMHYLGTAIIAFLSYIIIYTLNLTKEVKLSPFMIGLFTIVFALALGAVWEIGEFASDTYFGTHDQGDGRDPLIDTMYDLIWDGVAGLFIAIVGAAWLEGYPEIVNSFKKLIKKIEKRK